MNRKRYYFICRHCKRRKPVEEESRQKVGMCLTCFNRYIDAEFLEERFPHAASD